MKFISNKTLESAKKMFPSLGQIVVSRISSFATFTVNNDGDKIVYDPDGKCRKKKDILKSNQINIDKYLNQQNQNYLVAKYILQSEFHNHIVDSSQCNRIHSNLSALSLMNKEDLINALFKTKLSLQLQKNQNSKKQQYKIQIKVKGPLLAEKQRKNYYVVQNRIKISKYEQIENILHQNKLLAFQNINKILCLNIKGQSLQQVNQNIIKNEQLFLKMNIKIKNINFALNQVKNSFFDHDIPQQLNNDHGFNVYNVLQYVYRKQKGNILLHQFPDFYKFYLKLANYRKDQKIINRFTPLQIILFFIRSNQINKKCDVYQNLQQKFIQRTDNDQYIEDSTGLMIKRFLSKYNKIKYAKLLYAEEKGLTE